MNNDKGQGLIEAVVALGAAAIIIASIAIAVVSSVNNSDYTKNQNKATTLAQQELEIIGQKSRIDWASFARLSGTYCIGDHEDIFNKSSSDVSCPDPNISDIFIRQVDVSPGDGGNCSGLASGTSVTVMVKWIDGKCSTDNYCHKAEITSCFTGINTVPAP